MNIEALIKSLPDHWRAVNVDEPDYLIWWDDGRDYAKPVFIRKDGLARIYFNEGETENSGYLFAIAWDDDSDGDCRGSLDVAILAADAYVEKYHPKVE